LNKRSLSRRPKLPDFPRKSGTGAFRQGVAWRDFPHQLGLLTEKIDSLTVTVTTGFDELKAITRQQAETVSAGFAELKAITREQSETARQQAESVARLAATVERQAQIVERLLSAS
jgi:methyl-accepting chemotaxis protein